VTAEIATEGNVSADSMTSENATARNPSRGHNSQSLECFSYARAHQIPEPHAVETSADRPISLLEWTSASHRPIVPTTVAVRVSPPTEVACSFANALNQKKKEPLAIVPLFWILHQLPPNTLLTLHQEACL